MSPIERLQSDIYGVINALEYSEDISLHLWIARSSEQDALLRTQYEKAMAGQLAKGGKYGMAVFVMMPALTVPEGDAPGPDFEVITQLRIVENLRANMISTGTQKSTTDVAIELAGSLHQFSLGGAFGVLYCEGDSLGAIDPLQVEKGVIEYDVIVRNRFALQRPTRVANVRISGTYSAVTLTCATDGADIYYTIDGSIPHAGNPAATLYSGPFLLFADATVRAAAFKDDYYQSHVTSAFIEGPEGAGFAGSEGTYAGSTGTYAGSGS